MIDQATMPPLRVGLAGLGTVGGGVYKILTQDHDHLVRQCGRRIEVAAASARNPDKARDFTLREGCRFVTDPLELASDPEIDVVVELMGGAEGAAKDLVVAAIENGKAVVTANKALLSLHGASLARLAEERNTPLKFESAVAAGLPIIKIIREALSGNHISRLCGIINGSTNAILSMMAQENLDYETAIQIAGEKGWLEADPSLDLDGWDAAHKLSLLIVLSYGRWCPVGSMAVSGISGVTDAHLRLAAQLGGGLRLIGRAEPLETGLLASVGMHFISGNSHFYPVSGTLNGILVDGSRTGQLFISGSGAGQDTTASGVIADLVDLARGNVGGPVFGRPAEGLKTLESLIATPPLSDYVLMGGPEGAKAQSDAVDPQTGAHARFYQNLTQGALQRILNDSAPGTVAYPALPA